jgi:hypothetical protein
MAMVLQAVRSTPTSTNCAENSKRIQRVSLSIPCCLRERRSWGCVDIARPGVLGVFGVLNDIDRRNQNASDDVAQTALTNETRDASTKSS